MFSLFWWLVSLLLTLEIKSNAYLYDSNHEEPRFKRIDAPVSRRSPRWRRQVTLSCIHTGNNYNNSQEWDHITTSEGETPKYGFKMICLNGTVQVLGCYENDLFIPVNFTKPSGVHAKFGIACTPKGFEYKKERTCRGHPIGDKWTKGFYRFHCSETGLKVIACMDLDGNEHQPGDTFTALKSYMMICRRTSSGGLAVEAISCFDDSGTEIVLNGTKRSKWYIRTCQERRNAKGRQFEVSLNISHCCEATTNHCIPVDTQEPAQLFPEQQLTFACVRDGDEFSYRYYREDGSVYTVDESQFVTSAAEDRNIGTSGPTPDLETVPRPTAAAATEGLTAALQQDVVVITVTSTAILNPPPTAKPNPPTTFVTVTNTQTRNAPITYTPPSINSQTHFVTVTKTNTYQPPSVSTQTRFVTVTNTHTLHPPITYPPPSVSSQTHFVTVTATGLQPVPSRVAGTRIVTVVSTVQALFPSTAVSGRRYPWNTAKRRSSPDPNLVLPKASQTNKWHYYSGIKNGPKATGVNGSVSGSKVETSRSFVTRGGGSAGNVASWVEWQSGSGAVQFNNQQGRGQGAQWQPSHTNRLTKEQIVNGVVVKVIAGGSNGQSGLRPTWTRWQPGHQTLGSATHFGGNVNQQTRVNAQWEPNPSAGSGREQGWIQHTGDTLLSNGVQANPVDTAAGRDVSHLGGRTVSRPVKYAGSFACSPCLHRARCPQGWLKHPTEDMCYYLSSFRNRKNFEQAERSCQNAQGHLLVLNSNEEWIYIMQQLNAARNNYPGYGYDGFWIGYHYNNPLNRWNWIRYNGILSVPWLPESRRRTREKRDEESLTRSCAEIRWDKDRWGVDNDQCLHKQWFICELCIVSNGTESRHVRKKRQSSPDVATTTVLQGEDDGGCRNGWIEFNRRCYFYSRGASRLSVDDAAAVCTNHGAHLVVVNNRQEWDFLEFEANRQRALLSDHGFDGYWLGLRLDETSQQWRWTRDSNWYTLPWLPTDLRRLRRQRAQLGENRRLTCGEMRLDLDRWGADKDHCNHLQGYICEKMLDDAGGSGDCRQWKYRCGADAECVRSDDGQWRCVCRAGYRISALGKCVDVDECMEGVCGADAYCQNTVGGYHCYCQSGYRPVDGKCLEFGVCVTYGDPHYVSFDGARLHYQGICRNILVESSDGPTKFRVDSRSETRGNVTGFSWTRDIFVAAYGYEFGLLKDGRVTVNGAAVNLPFSLENDKVRIEESSIGQTLRTDFGLEVVYDGDSRAEVRLSSEYKSKTTGMCGNFNGNPADDWRSPNGDLITDPGRFGNSWIVPSDQDKECLIQPSQPHECSPGGDKYKTALTYCKALETDGLFRQCYITLQLDASAFVTSCAIDVCSSGPPAACKNFANVAAICAEAGRAVTQWRTKLNCAPAPCRLNAEYRECGPSCPETCATALGQKRKPCIERCVEGCTCLQGFVLSGTDCVARDQCGCLVANRRYMKPSDRWFQPACQVRCVCLLDGRGRSRTDCQFARCHEHHADCVDQGDQIFQCVCKRGYQGDGVNCQDINECSIYNAQGRAYCPDLNQVCINTDGSFACDCGAGASMVDGVCQDIDECTKLDAVCGDPIAICQNVIGSYRCLCPRGYVASIPNKQLQDQFNQFEIRCDDIDECLMNIHTCDATTSYCQNFRGSYKCVCRSGYCPVETHPNVCTRAACDIANGPGVCHANAECVQVGQDLTRCVCRRGFEGDGINVCKDIDECSDATLHRGCVESGGVCVNVVGSFQCRCGAGLRSNQLGFCEDVDECRVFGVHASCGPYAECRNTYGGFACRCQSGYFRPPGNGSFCRDIDECASGQHRCDRNAECQNTDGGYACRCTELYYGDGFTCTPRDMCDSCDDGIGCDHNAQCFYDSNSPRGYSCACHSGFIGDGFTCQDLNECVDYADWACPRDSDCINTPGSYFCQCRPGFVRRGEACTPLALLRRSGGCNQKCDMNATCGAKGNCVCARGFVGTGLPDECADVDECSYGTDKVCGPHSECENTVGSFVCRCLEGFHSNPCQDVDECATVALNNCDLTAICVNTPGSFKCLCSGDGDVKNNGSACHRDETCALLGCDENSQCISDEDGPKCRCKVGFTGNGFECIDVNECTAADHSTCSMGSNCVNIVGSYTCRCAPGFEQLGTMCEDIDECKTECQFGVCRNTYGSFVCSCPNGYRLSEDSKRCIDIDECHVACQYGGCDDGGGGPLCPSDSQCINTDGGFACGCVDGDCCLDNQRNNCVDEAECVDLTNGTFECRCKSGYVAVAGRWGMECVDVDECLSTHCPLRGTCINTDGSYDCLCSIGFSGDNCQDVDECATGQNRCHANASCVNVVGSFVCRCHDGFYGDGYNVCTPSCECGPNAMCADGVCRCKNGFTLRDHNECVDVDECSSTASPCRQEHEFCFNYPGTYACRCQQGYTRNRSNEKCQDENECDSDPDVCSRTEICVNTPGSYKCECLGGYRLDKQSAECVDKDECAENLHHCVDDRTCFNTIGSFRCDCGIGYRRVGAECRDADECEEAAPCGNSADVNCRNTPGSYRCECTDGFAWNISTLTCQDVDECAEKIDVCNSQVAGNSICVNVDGGYRCRCQNGYEGANCTNIDECRWGGDDCSPFATCQDTEGSYICTCRSGFTGNGRSCTDIDECVTIKPCNSTGECLNTLGSYHCRCRQGYVSFMGNCRDIDECEAELISCSGADQVCQNTNGGYECVCRNGFILRNEICVDINECVDTGSVCADDALCTNLQGSYTCSCPVGFIGDPYRSCTDIDECAQQVDDCPVMERCVNTIGSFQCECKPPNQRVTDDGECHPACSCAANEICAEDVGVCRCAVGYELVPTVNNHGSHCSDVDECAIGSYRCPPEALCRNIDGGFICECVQGYRLVDDKCIDIDECLERTNAALCPNGSLCVNVKGSYECACAKCHKKSEDGSCVYDVCCDCDVAAMCLQGRCRCRPGFIGDGVQCREACAENACSDRAECVPDSSSGVGYMCRCAAGLTGDGLFCTEKVMESCERLQVDCGNGSCLSGAVGTDDYICICRPGFRFKDGFCVDVDECAIETDRSTLCGGNDKTASCVNIYGGYSCVCKQLGTLWDQETERCIKSKQNCAEAGSKICERLNAKCIDKDSGYECKCPRGYKKNQEGVCIERLKYNRLRYRRQLCTNDLQTLCHGCAKGFQRSVKKYKCEDINECKQHVSDCPPPTVCTNLKGGYACACPVGYRLGDGGSKMCVDVNECLDAGFNRCDSGTLCVNTIGSYGCPCQPGYTRQSDTRCTQVRSMTDCHAICGEHGRCVRVTSRSALLRCVCDKGFVRRASSFDGGVPSLLEECVDVDECALGIDDCHPQATCTNSVGSFECHCRNRFTGDGRTCEPADVCRDEQPCHVHGDCYPLLSGGYRCMCKRGYVGDGQRSCLRDICSESHNGGCPTTASCSMDKQSGKRTCLCFSGFFGPNCADVDECKTAGVCPSNSICQNVHGSYACFCKTGYSGDTHNSACVDVDECSTDKLPCHKNADCINTLGSYTCRCQKGYRGDGMYCESVSGCAGGCPSHSDCVLRPGGQRVCQCQFGYNPVYTAQASIVCQDINECSGGLALCPNDTKCVNTDGNYECRCDEGYRLIGVDCVDINECLEQKPCPKDQHCLNTRGSYRCSCEDGYAFVDGKCIDVDECVEQAGVCDSNARCFNGPGGYLCSCKHGFTGSGRVCVDLDECAVKKDSCKAPGQECINTIGSFYCICPSGTRFSAAKSNCEDVNECEDGNPCDVSERASCTNLIGSYHCECRSGYTGDGRLCAPVTHCDPSQCAENAHCVDDGHSEKCRCLVGYFGDGLTKCQSTYTSCRDHDCSSKADCIPLAYGYDCRCKPGYSLVLDACHDVDECAAGIADCDPGRTVCRNTVGSYVCQCRPGFQKGRHSSRCIDVDECQLDIRQSLCGGSNSGRCVNTDGGYRCICNSGYFSVQKHGHNTCELIPGCLSSHQCATNARCVNRRCECLVGYRKSTNGRLCIDVDECAEDLDKCDRARSICENTVGGHHCRCKPGYTGQHCNDIDECALRGFCHQYAICRNLPGSYECSCPAGYWGDGRRCVPLRYTAANRPRKNKRSLDELLRNSNRCDEHTQPCGRNARCIGPEETGLLAGGNKSEWWVAECVCERGFWGNPYTECIDYNECQDTPSRCPTGSVCENSVGSFKCLCRDGFTGGGQSLCHDVDECESELDICNGENERCVNTYGSYYCYCAHGYRRSRTDNSCTDIDECERPSVCHTDAECTNSPGAFECSCKTGFEGDGRVMCFPKEGCDAAVNCDANSQCVSVANGNDDYSCVCNRGFILIDNRCADVDECVISSAAVCSYDADCVNTHGSYYCKCRDGFQGDGKQCIDVDECKMADRLCGSGSLCVNQMGSYECRCLRGFRRMANSSCIDVNECAEDSRLCLPHKCRNTLGAYVCDCTSGYRRHPTTGRCQDVDECVEHPNTMCGLHGVCFNTAGSYACRCQSGFEADTTGHCADIDECSGVHDCGKNGQCVNTLGSYKCQCSYGFINVEEKCIDVDECAEPIGSTHHHRCARRATCYNTEGSFECRCNRGYHGTGIECADIDECEEGNGGPCDELSTCVNTDGAFKCICRSGYRRWSMMDGGGDRRCADVDECAERRDACWTTHGRRSSCTNTPGSFACSCADGYALNTTTQQCVDVNECLKSNEACNSDEEVICINTPGSFVCDCNLGYQWDGEKCIDTNECNAVLDPCSTRNAYCVNEIGSYRCECLAGRVMVGGHCESICARHTCPPGQRCNSGDNGAACQCDVASTTAGLINDRLCTTRRFQFNSLADMAEDGCERSVPHRIDYYGECLDDCETADGRTVKCDFGFICVRNPISGFPTCTKT